MPDTATPPSSGSLTDVEAVVGLPTTGGDTEKERKEEEDVNLVTWNGPDDPENPQNYSTRYKFFITGIWIYGNLCATLASSIWSSGAKQVAAEFHQSTIVVTLGISLFLLVSTSPPPSPYDSLVSYEV